MLPSFLSRSAPAPLSRPVSRRESTAAIMDDAEDLGLQKLNVQTPTASPPPPPPPARGVLPSRPVFGQSTNTERKAPQSASDAPDFHDACVASSIARPLGVTTEESVLRETILSSMLKQEHRGAPLLREKHHYGYITPTAWATGVEAGSVLTTIPVGSTWNTRVGPQVWIKHIHLRFFIYASTNNATLSATTVIPPLVRFVLKRVRLPYTPGTTEPAMNTDSSPPGTAAAIFSGLGVSPFTQSHMLMNAVFNPCSVPEYELLRQQTFPQIKSDVPSMETSFPRSNIATGLTYYNNPVMWSFDWKVPLHTLVTFDLAQAFAITNQIEWTAIAIFDALNAMAIAASYDVIFEDVTTE